MTPTCPTLAASRRGAPDGVALYVHLPFCAAKCTYCDFFSLPVGAAAEGGGAIDRVNTAILREAERFAPRKPQTLYLGGGTPSLLSSAQLQHLLKGLDSITAYRDSAQEVSIECNPESLDRDKARGLVDLGVTRLTLGFQSLDDQVLGLFGRVHSTDQAFRAFEAAREAGVASIAVDLIYGSPGQSPAQWTRDLTRVLQLGPEHVSAYNLAFEEDTPFSRWLEEGSLEKLSEQSELELFLLTRQVLAASGYRAYEISNFARPGHECRHNQNYWRNLPYVGLGPSAVSKLGPTRSGNPRSLEAWLQALEDPARSRPNPVPSGARPPRPSEDLWEETLAPLARLGETWWLGLRTAEGVDPVHARRASQFEGVPPDPAERLAGELARQNLLEHRADPHPSWAL